MKLSDNQLKMILLSSNLITYDALETIFKEAQESNVPLLDLLPKSGLVTSEKLGSIVADALKYNFINLKEENIDEKILHEVPEVVARSRGIIAFGQSPNGIKVGMTDPEDFEMIRLLEKKFCQKLVVYYITKQDAQGALIKYHGSVQDEVNLILEKLKNSDTSSDERDESTIKLIDVLFQYGYQSKASDVHIEPYTHKVVVRFRIDGILHDVLEITKDLLELLLTRIKIMSKMRTDEHRAAQDGKFRFEIAGEAVDARVSVLPVIEGEKVVVRLLSSKSRQYELQDIGLSGENLVKVNRAICNPHGMILVTGPTGSGKTTTVYGVLKILNKREVNISSIEDPVEYNVEGVNQIQVNAKTNLTFANGLRSILRQDPDIIMIGEIRDQETASIAVNSALTGHLVLSTLHTNDAATTLPRLLDMGIEPFLVASTVNICIAQRLVRQICPKCRVSQKLTDEDKDLINSNSKIKEIFEKEGYDDLDKVRFYKGLGCKACGKTGFRGRIGIFEVLEMNEGVRRLVIDKKSSDDIIIAARHNGMKLLLEDGVDKILRGVTTFVEVLRVTG